MEKLLLSAMSNWRNANDGNGSKKNVYVKEVFVNQGRSLKRIKPAPQGRAHRIRKRSNHITVVVSDNNEAVVEENETEA